MKKHCACGAEIVSRAIRCRDCYSLRGPTGSLKPKRHCACGAELSRGTGTHCRACWLRRGKGADGAIPPALCKVCHERPISVGSKQGTCVTCYHGRRSDAEAAIAGPSELDGGIRKALKAGPKACEQIAALVGHTPGQVLDGLLGMKARGVNVQQFGTQWSIELAPEIGHEQASAYVSRPNGRYRFGWLGDTHLCSKYFRADVLGDIYRRFANADIDRIFHAGNWIDGEARFNKYDLVVHGMDAQIRYLRDEYPIAPNGLTTYAIAGDDLRTLAACSLPAAITRAGIASAKAWTSASTPKTR